MGLDEHPARAAGWARVVERQGSAMSIRKDDIVEVITGDDAGNAKGRTTARVLRVLPDKQKVVVEGINRVYRHLKPNRRNAQGGRLSKEMPVAISNALLSFWKCPRGVPIARGY